MNILLATLLELELTGTVENIGDQIYRIAAELELIFTDLNKKQDGTNFYVVGDNKITSFFFKKFQIHNHPTDFNYN